MTKHYTVTLLSDEEMIDSIQVQLHAEASPPIGGFRPLAAQIFAFMDKERFQPVLKRMREVELAQDIRPVGRRIPPLTPEEKIRAVEILDPKYLEKEAAWSVEMTKWHIYAKTLLAQLNRAWRPLATDPMPAGTVDIMTDTDGNVFWRVKQ